MLLILVILSRLELLKFAEFDVRGWIPTFCPRWQKVAKSTAKKGKGQQNVASFPPLGTPPSYGRICRKLLFNLSFFILLNRLFFLALLSMWILQKLFIPEHINVTLKLKQTARRSSYLTFGRYVFANDIPTTRIKARSWRLGYQGGTPWHVFFVY